MQFEMQTKQLEAQTELQIEQLKIQAARDIEDQKYALEQWRTEQNNKTSIEVAMIGHATKTIQTEVIS